MLTIKRLSIADAELLIVGARAKAVAIGVPMCIAVSDESGNLIAFARMDGAKVPSITIAIDKSFTAAGIRNGTHKLHEVSQPGQPVYGIASTLGGRMITIAGGLPVLVDGDVVGAIGVSTGSPAQDLEVAQAGIEMLLNQQQSENVT